MVQRIWLRCSRFLMKTATLKRSKLPIIMIDYNDYILCLQFLSKLSFEKETIAKIGRATALKLLVYKPIFSPCSYFVVILIQ